LEETALVVRLIHIEDYVTHLRREGVDTSVVLGSRINVSVAKKEKVKVHTSLGT
jgi:hypothetical protein